MNTNNPFMPTPGTAGGPGTPAAGPTPGQGLSDGFEVDLTNVQGGFTIPDGLYRMRCLDVQQEVSKSGNPMFVWDFAIVDGDQAGKDFRLWTAITPAAMWKVAETVVALGVGQTGQVVKFGRADVVNKECGALMEQDDYNGNTSSKISKVIPLQEYLDSLKK